MAEITDYAKTAIRLPFETKRERLTAADMGIITRLKHPRPLRDGTVRKFVRILENGGSIKQPITVNQLGIGDSAEKRVFDGNHRVEAVRLFLQNHPAASIWVEFHIYHDLDATQEMDEFIELNTIGGKATLNDLIISMQDRFPILPLFKQGFPATVKVGKIGQREHAFSFRWLCQAYLSRASEGKVVFRILSRLEQLGRPDYEEMKDAARVFVDGAGAPGVENPFAGPTALAAYFKVWWINRVTHTLTTDEFARRWKKAATSSHAVRTIAAASKTASELKNVTDTLVSEMNRVDRRRGWIPTFNEFRAQSERTKEVTEDGSRKVEGVAVA